MADRSSPRRGPHRASHAKSHATSPRVAVTPSRTAAAQILADLRQGLLLDASFERRTTTLDVRDRRWVQELVWGLLRVRSRLDAILAARVRGGLGAVDPDVIDLLRLGTYQLLAMDSVPPYAAIGQTVELTKTRHNVGAGMLVNAVLRRVDRERTTIDPPAPSDPVEALALATGHPAWIVARWEARWGLETTRALLEANNTPAAVHLRAFGITTTELARALADESVMAEPSPLVPDSLRLPSGVSLTELTAYREGRFYVQDPAASLVAAYAHLDEGSVVADLCAAPGGKALELARRARFVIASERSPARLARMQAGFARLGVTTVLPCLADATAPALAPVDAVLVDVPCTGTGTYRRHPDARWRLRISDFAVLGMTQQAILRAAAAVVRPGGLLIYSTCSLELEENDEQIASFLRTNPEFVLEPPPDGCVPSEVIDGGFLRVLPHRQGTDGAFAARLRRRA